MTRPKEEGKHKTSLGIEADPVTSVLAEDLALRDVTGLSTPHDDTDLVGSAPR